jgi:hypothetical protein
MLNYYVLKNLKKIVKESKEYFDLFEDILLSKFQN